MQLAEDAWPALECGVHGAASVDCEHTFSGRVEKHECLGPGQPSSVRSVHLCFHLSESSGQKKGFESQCLSLYQTACHNGIFLPQALESGPLVLVDLSSLFNT